MLEKITYGAFIAAFLFGVAIWIIAPPVLLWISGVFICKILAAIWTISVIFVSLFLIGFSISNSR